MTPETPKEIWQRKLEFLRVEEAKAADAEQRFSIRERIAEVEAQLQRLEPAEAGSPREPHISPIQPTHAADPLSGCRQEYEDGTNVAAGTPFCEEHGARVLPWYNPAEARGSPNWKEKWAKLRSRFERIIDECCPLQCVLVQKRIPAYPPVWPELPANVQGRQVVLSRGGLSREPSKLVTPNWEPLDGLFPVNSVQGKPMLNSRGAPQAFRFGVWRYYVVSAPLGWQSGSRPLPMPQLTELAGDGTHLLYQLPANIAVFLWRNWPSGFSRGRNSGESLRLDALLELSWQNQPGSPLYSERFAWIENGSVGLLGDGLFPRLPNFMISGPGTSIPHENGCPMAYYSKLTDVAKASVAAIDEILERETITSNHQAKRAASSGTRRAPQGSGRSVRDFSSYCEGDTDPSLNKRIHALIDSDEDYIVYLDDDLCVEYSWTEAYGKTPRGFDEIANKTAHLETLSMTRLGRQQMEPFRRLLAEAMARMVGDKSIQKARSALRSAESYLQATAGDRPAPTAGQTVMTRCKILFFAANPSGTTPLALDEESREIDQKIRAAEYRDALELITKWAVRPDDLLQYLNQHRPHVVHFSGHGSTDEEIVLLGSSGQPKPVSKAALTQLFATLKDNIRVVVLNACHSQPQAEAITEVIDCLVGVKRAIGDQAAITFAAAFYRAVGFGRSVQEAFDQGKTALMLEGIPEENTPELIVRKGADPKRIFLVHCAHPATNR